MTDDLPKIFDQCTPQPAPAELRGRTLSAVGRELSRRRTPRWERGFELAVAASLLLGIGLNVRLWRTDATLQIGQSPQPASVAGPAASQSARHELARAESQKRVKDATGNDQYRRLLHELSQGRIPESL